MERLNDAPKKRKKKKKWVWVILPIFSFAFCLIFTLDQETILLSLLSVCGIFLCRSIISYMMRNNDPLVRVFCADKGIFSCDEVLTSPVAKVYRNINWGDIGLVYFFSLSLFLLFAAVADRLQEAVFILMVPCSMAFLASFFSIWYQGRVVGKWCKLCLSVILVVWLQESVLVAVFLSAAGQRNTILLFLHNMPLLLSWTALLLFCLTLASYWFALKPFILRGKEAENLRQQMRRWKRSPSLFMHLLKKQSPVTDVSLTGDFRLGAESAPMKIVAVLSLYCPSCKRDCRELIKLLNKFQKDLQVTIRIRHPQNSKRPDALPYLLAWYSGAKDQRAQQEIFTKWFESMDIARCQEKLGLVSIPDHTDISQALEAWFSRNNIRQTPSLFFDRYPLSEPFLLTDLDLLIPNLRKYFGDTSLIFHPTNLVI
jgi:uncharacterized membrane protein